MQLLLISEVIWMALMRLSSAELLGRKLFAKKTSKNSLDRLRKLIEDLKHLALYAGDKP